MRHALPALTLLAAAIAQAGPLAYVSNEGSGTLSVIDTATDAVLYELPAGAKPRGAVISPDGRRAYVSDQPGNRLVDGENVVDCADAP